MSIVFWSHSRQCRELSTFRGGPIELDGKCWPSVEHYYQAQKFAGSPMEEAVREAPTPQAARKLARSPSPYFVDDWDSRRLKVMSRALEAKFKQNGDLRELLLSTGDEELVHWSRHDCFWGRRSDSIGENMLGRLLMDLRRRLRGARKGERS